MNLRDSLLAYIENLGHYFGNFRRNTSKEQFMDDVTEREDKNTLN